MPRALGAWLRLIPLGQSRLRRKYGLTVVAVKCVGEEFTYATADTELGYGDVIIVSGRIQDIERFSGLS
ncbi:TrkA C-terminal domain-containing protein [Nonomuraea diastatica]|uniref:TrkA C-terminal domain-containing protein n=1 Tax=Nonomuraea diastatica TaxID=1848329 RepID=UPI001FEB8BB1|nr:TrkA C-terminal domain-containing protein [Nonomuraea diastatica]